MRGRGKKNSVGINEKNAPIGRQLPGNGAAAGSNHAVQDRRAGTRLDKLHTLAASDVEPVIIDNGVS